LTEPADQTQPRARPRNRILSALNDATLERMRTSLRLVQLEARRILYDVDEPIERVYFPETAVTSVVAPMSDGSAVETAVIGCEGFVGLPVFLGASQMTAQCFAQVPGTAYEMASDDFRRLLGDRDDSLQRILNRYTQGLFTQIAQSSGCNRRHDVRQRCARWLLLTHDRVDSDTFPLTQRFLSQMLGVQRTTVTAAAKALEEAQCIVYRHGVITISDRAALERESCECYEIIRAEFDRLLDSRDVPSVFGDMRTSSNGDSVLGDAKPDVVSQ
jgi:CRP-like cAMP-binding protein